MRVTLRDISKKLGISTTAISLVLNGKPNRISDDMRQLIIATASEMNYQPNQSAVNLVKRRTHAIGLIIPDISNLFFADLAKGVDDAIIKEKYSLMITNTNDSVQLDLDYINMLSSRGADAIIIALASSINVELIPLYKKVISDFGKPVILVDRYAMSLNCSTITLNHRKGAYIALQHLFDLGHSRIACLTGPTQLLNTIEMLDGVRSAFSERHCAFPQSSIFEGNYQVGSGYALADKIVSGGYSAVFCFNDMMAYGLYKRFSELSIHVPKDISVVGFDDIFFSDLIDVPLTTVKQPAYNIGESAGARALYEISHPEHEKQTTFFEPTIKVRRSTSAFSDTQ